MAEELKLLGNGPVLDVIIVGFLHLPAELRIILQDVDNLHQVFIVLETVIFYFWSLFMALKQIDVECR